MLTETRAVCTSRLAGLHKIFAELTIISVLLIPVVSLARVSKLVRVHTVNVPAFDLSSAVSYLYNADRMLYDALLKLFVVAYALYLGSWFLLRRQRTLGERAAW